MSVSDVFSIGLSALYAQKLALEVTSENISNVNTPGYSKQTAIL
jgi:flagellar hook-associated protein 1